MKQLNCYCFSVIGNIEFDAQYELRFQNERVQWFFVPYWIGRAQKKKVSVDNVDNRKHIKSYAIRKMLSA